MPFMIITQRRVFSTDLGCKPVLSPGHISLSRFRKHGYLRIAATSREVTTILFLIILLAAVISPVLMLKRKGARIVACKNQCKMIADLTETYRADYQGYLPVLFNYDCGAAFGYHSEPILKARNSLLSVAFRHYDSNLKNLETTTYHSDGSLFDPDTIWSTNKRMYYETEIMPDYFACPFTNNNKEVSITDLGVQNVDGEEFTMSSFEGKINSYVTWQWEGRVVADEIPIGYRGRSEGPNHSRPKFSILSWNKFRLDKRMYPVKGNGKYFPKDFIARKPREGPSEEVQNTHRKWTVKDARRVKAVGLDEVTVIYCFSGQSMGYADVKYNRPIIYNLGSHPKTTVGGTNAVFADSHVEWVEGTSIGWP